MQNAEYKEEKHLLGIRLKNFFHKITILTQYSALLAILCIVLLAITLIFPKINIEITYKYLFENICDIHYIKLVKFFTIIFYRGCIIYFLLDFLLITIYIISAFYDYFISEINKL